MSAPAEKLISDLIYLAGNGIATGVYLYVAVRLYLLSRRTGLLPEFLIAVSFLLWVLSYLFYDIPYAILRSDEWVPAFCTYGSLVTLSMGNIVFAFFIRSVFRPDSRWAMGLVVAITGSLIAGLAGTAWAGSWDGVNPFANLWYWFEYFGNFVPSVWMGAEGFTQYVRARRRLKLGLSEPLVCNQFLLWGIAGTLWMILEGLSTANEFVYTLMGHWSDLLNFWIAPFEVAPVAIVWFVFFPPEFYRRWVDGKGTLAGAEPPAAD